jgi:peptidoglycan/LPS O-acetylase OafA/YrhL
MQRSTAQHIPYLDGWRGLAILFLLIGHFFPVSGINLGAVGVNLFFVLSGALMARILFIDRVPLPVFYQRRIARILPAVFFFLVAIVLAHAIFGKQIDWTETAAAATFLNNYFPGAPGAAIMPFGHIWSLSVEEHSYIVLSIVAVIAGKSLARVRTALGVLAVLSVLAGVWYWASYTGNRLGFDRWLRTEVSAFGIVFSALLLVCLHGRKPTRLPLIVFALLMALGFALQWWSVPAPLATIVGVGAFSLALNLLHLAQPAVHAALSWGPLRQLGLWSFSVYLWQQPFYLYVRKGGMSPVAGICLALFAGVLSYYLIERPARAFLNKDRRLRTGTPPVTAEAVVEEATLTSGTAKRDEGGGLPHALTGSDFR